MKRLRRYIVAGILVWLPIGVTIFLLRILVGLLDRTLVLIPAKYQPEQFLGFAIPGLGIVLTILVLLVTGVLAANFVGRAMVNLWESALHRIPVVRSVYSAAKNFAEIVFSDSSQSFKKVLLIEYPRKGLYSLAFQTSSELGDEALKMIISLGVVVPTWRQQDIGELPLEMPAEAAEKTQEGL
jgi:uncharacterized membrane protein